MGHISFSLNSWRVKASLEKAPSLRSTEESVDQNNLPDAQGRQRGPGEELARSQTQLAGFAQPEPDFHRADRNQVAIAQEGLFHRLIIYRGSRAGINLQHKTFGHL